MFIYEEKKVSSQEVYKGKIIKVRVDDVLLPNGHQSTREVVEHPGAVAIVALNEQKEVLFVRQFRYPAGKDLLEIPAGKIDAGEKPAVSASRELWEETGYQASQWKSLATCYASPGFSNEKLYIYLAQGLIPAAQHLDEDEFVQIESYPLDKTLDMIDKGQLQDAKSIVGILAAKRYLDHVHYEI